MGEVSVPSPGPGSHVESARPGPGASSIAALALAIAGTVAMVDLAVETFAAGAPLRWWALAAAAACVGSTVVARRRRAGWSAQLTIVLVFALGLAAAIAWRPGGLTDGVRLAGQPTARVLSTLTTVTLVVAIAAILRATLVPLAGRLAGSLLALYGVAAFALGAWRTTAYPALFAGDSVWRVLPRWLQGGVIGGLVVLPLALLVALAGGLARGRRSWRPPPIVALALTLAVVASAFWNGASAGLEGVRLDLGAAGAGASAEAREITSQPDPRAFADVAALIARAASSPEPSTLDVDRTAAAIGNDPAALFAYVHDHVRTEIYSGVLRGARGTLMGGAGNAWDQAVLLAAMLRHEGRDVRFAHARLAPDVAARIVDRMFADAARPRAPSGPLPQVPDSLKTLNRARLAQIQAEWGHARSDLLGALDRAHLSLGDTAVSEQTLESEAADHLFVEYRDGDRWISLDPVATAAPGASVASDAESFADIPDAFYHHVTIRVVIETRRDQKLDRQEVLRYPTTAAALDGARVLLLHGFGHDITGRWRATPVLQVDGHAYAARTFDETGLVAGKANSKEDLISQAHQSMTELGQVTALFGGAQAPPTSAGAQLTAESLEVEFTDPARHSEVVRRELIDRIGAVARAGRTAATAPLAPIAAANGVPLQLAGLYACAFASGPLDPALPIRRLSSVGGLVGDLQALAGARPAANAPLPAEDHDRLTRVLDQYPALLQASAESAIVLSQRLAGRLRVGGAAPLFYEATPRLVIASFDLTAGLALDLRRDSVRALARGLSGSEIVRANLARSVADAAIEGALMMPRAEPRRITALDIFDRARAEGIPLIALRAGSPLAAVQASVLARARMAIVEPGRLLVAPGRTPAASPSHFAWWQLDPSTGEAVSVLDTGLNGAQELPEYAETNAISPMAYEVAPPDWGPISPMASEIAAPRAQCVIFDADMLLELLEAITATGG